MIYIFLGVVAYVFFVLYDINSIVIKNKLLSWSFFAGFILFAAATGGVVASSWKSAAWNLIRAGLCGSLALLFLLLLIYTLFFALPFKDTYIEAEGPPKVCRCGVYALCRHPGVLCLTGFYLFLGLALYVPLLFIAAIIFGGLDVLYVIFQDRWTFEKSFKDYGDYRKDTPFLIPSTKSIKRCIHTLNQKEGMIS